MVTKTGIETGNETKPAYSLVEDNHYIMHSYTIIYGTHQARLLVADFSARRLSIRDIKCLLLSEGSGDSIIEFVKFFAWVGER